MVRCSLRVTVYGNGIYPVQGETVGSLMLSELGHWLVGACDSWRMKSLQVNHQTQEASRIPWVFSFYSYKKAGRVEAIWRILARLSNFLTALTLEGKIAIVGDKLFASTGKTSVFGQTEATCQEAHGSIAAPRNLNENKAIQKIVQHYNSYAYLGIMESDQPGKFHFRNGDPLNFTNWYKNEPSGQGAEKCVEMYNDGTWNDKMCNNYRLEVCEF
uniref:C-type lectin domain-containing protein n=1 Tax=Pseudonaja textilis TaxID=8673 RepID=A0A670YUE1_PSETE